MTSESEAEDRSEEKRRLELAYFCLSRARKALRHMYKLSIDSGVMSEDGFFESSSEMEDMVIALQHVYKSCKLLNANWPTSVRRAPLGAANRFVKVWDAANGEDLRHAYSHYEEAITLSGHELREDAADDVTWHKIEYPPVGGVDVSNYTARPQTVVLLGKAYSLEGVCEALAEVEKSLREVFARIAAPVEPSEPGSAQVPLTLFSAGATGNFSIVMQHNHLGGGIDWEKKKEIDAARSDEDS